MINAVGRDIPEEILKITGKEVFHGNNYYDGYEYKKDGPITKCVMNNSGSKLVKSIHEALVKCEIKDGMTLGFHHHFREGDYIVNMVMEEIHKMGIKDITICASSLGKAHDPIVPYIEDGTITNIQSSGVCGKIGEAISNGKLKGLAIMRSHGGRVRAIETGETRIDIAFIGAPTCDDYGNCRGIGGKSDCGVLSYAMVDGDYADKVVAITDCLVPFPNFPAYISMTKVDYVVEVDVIGDPKKIATGAAKPTTDQRKLMMAEYCTQFVVNTPYFKDGFSYQTGVGGASIASTYIFMIGCAVALFVNYPGAKLQNKIIKSHSGPALMMASTILAAGVFLGVLEDSEIMTHMANVLASFIPQPMGRFLPLIIGVLSVPLTLMFCTDSYFFGLLPVLISIGNKFGVNPAHTAIAMVVCRNCATFISPVVPATFLGVGLAGVEIKDHIKACFFWIWGVSIVCLISGLIFGVIKF